MKTLTPKEAMETYWFFVNERHRIFLNRLQANPHPWTEDPLLAVRKFTNTYRVLDRTTQFLIREVQGIGSDSREELFFRTILMKMFNLPQTYYSLATALESTPTWKTYNFAAYSTLLNTFKRERPIYSTAYMMSGMVDSKEFSVKVPKHYHHLKIIEHMMNDDLPKKVEYAHSLEEVINLLKKYSSIGDFLSYQFATDLSYTWLGADWNMEHVTLGPGSHKGLAFCGVDKKEALPFMKDVWKNQVEHLSPIFTGLWGRPLDLIDIQNCFCELGKYLITMGHDSLVGRVNARLRDFNPLSYDRRVILPNHWNLSSSIKHDRFMERYYPINPPSTT